MNQDDYLSSITKGRSTLIQIKKLLQLTIKCYWYVDKFVKRYIGLNIKYKRSNVTFHPLHIHHNFWPNKIRQTRYFMIMFFRVIIRTLGHLVGFWTSHHHKYVIRVSLVRYVEKVLCTRPPIVWPLIFSLVQT